MAIETHTCINKQISRLMKIK